MSKSQSLIVAFDVTGFTSEQITALTSEVCAQSEENDDHPDAQGGRPGTPVMLVGRNTHDAMSLVRVHAIPSDIAPWALTLEHGMVEACDAAWSAKMACNSVESGRWAVGISSDPSTPYQAADNLWRLLLTQILHSTFWVQRVNELSLDSGEGGLVWLLTKLGFDVTVSPSYGTGEPKHFPAQS